MTVFFLIFLINFIGDIRNNPKGYSRFSERALFSFLYNGHLFSCSFAVILPWLIRYGNEYQGIVNVFAYVIYLVPLVFAIDRFFKKPEEDYLLMRSW